VEAFTHIPSHFKLQIQITQNCKLPSDPFHLASTSFAVHVISNMEFCAVGVTMATARFSKQTLSGYGKQAENCLRLSTVSKMYAQLFNISTTILLLFKCSIFVLLTGRKSQHTNRFLLYRCTFLLSLLIVTDEWSFDFLGPNIRSVKESISVSIFASLRHKPSRLGKR
jgi:hypothetical protein